MSFLNRWLSSSRVRDAKKGVAKEPTARRYAELAHEYAVVGELADVLRTTSEGLKLFPGDAELKRLSDRARAMQLEGRTRELQVELKIAPRASLWKELCEILLESGRVARAEEVATEWFQATRSGEAQYYRAHARADRFIADRRRDDGRLAFDMVTAATESLPGDPRPLKLHLQLASRVGAWADARRVLARLLEHFPGDPSLEARFRSIITLSETSKTLDQALRAVEKSGRLVDEAPESDRASTSGSVRPLLKDILAESGVEAVFYVRGATALVQGPKGATAERTARGVREVVSSCRSAARKLGLGQALEVRIEGGFGTLLVAPGEQGSSALWCTGNITRRHEERLRDLAGIDGTAEVDA
jgi:hypothetical protein